MGSGASRPPPNRAFDLTQVTKRGESLGSLQSEREADRYYAKHQQQNQDELHNENNKFSTRNDETLTHDSVETEIRLEQTLGKYEQNHPQLALAFQQLFHDVQVLRQLSASSDTMLGEDVVIIVSNLVDTSIETFLSAGTEEEAKFTQLTNFLIDIEAAQVFQRLADRLFQQYFQTKGAEDNESWASTENDTMGRNIAVLQCLLTIMQNFADLTDGFCWACAEAGVIPMCFEAITRIDKEHENWESKGYEDRFEIPIQLMTTIVAILHNISRRLKDRSLFENCNWQETLVRFATVEMTKIASPALLCLAYLVDEDTNYLILADEKLLKFILTMLRVASQSEDRRCDGFSAKELAEGLGHLAVNDTNKKVLGEKGAIPILVSMLKTSKDDGEKASGTNALWMLAFDEKNKERIKKEEGAMECLRELQQSKNPDVQKAAAGALWELEGKRARSAGKREASGSSGNHVMISYQWDVQEVMIEVKNRLQSSGFKVWMDLEQMGGSTLESMAKAVENSSVVLVCVSQKYKESPNCRSEAEYAYQLRKDIIPLMVQQNYKPDGWLGMIVGTKLWIDFKSKHVIVSGVSKLVKELAGRGKDVDKEDLIDGHQEHAVVRAAVDTAVVSSPVTSSVFSWDTGDVETWLKEIGLDKSCKAIMSNLNGKTLIQLFHLREECPEYYYRCLKEDLLLGSMFNVFKFREELDKLMRT